ncbi:putative RNA polymerase II subunit B1 CTD phosphatase rpap2 isoform X2 [Channa argus]|uniref:putative RNA polymerase II subunit B1 CTD phosphatase rpap2 isoform X2 n=1 Tax=Channa argus TaxID=215402 RepID=UPI003521F45E
MTSLNCFCSNFCYKASKEFELQISKTPLWLRQHECPPEIKLLQRGDGGSPGEAVMLPERRLQEEDIEKPLSTLPEDPQSDNSDNEQEQDFVSSVISQKPGLRVHWGDLPKCTHEDKNGQQLKMKRKTQKRKAGDKEGTEHHESQDKESKAAHACKTDIRTDAEKPKQLYMINTDQPLPVEKEKLSLEEATAKLNLLNLSQVGTQNTSLLAESTLSQSLHTTPLTTTSCEDLKYYTESRPQLELSHSPLTNTANQNNHNTMLPNQADLKITQVGMSKRGAAGLRDLLRNQSNAPTPDSIRLNLLESLKKTLKEWSTDETLKFLYGADHSLGSPFADVEDKNREEEEGLDEDDIEDEVTGEDRERANDGVQKKPSAAAPNYEALQKETQKLELRVREFYKGTWIVPVDLEEQSENKMTVQEQCTKEPVLPLVDSHAQRFIQKRVTVEKLNSCLRNIVGPLHLTMSDITTNLNNLVRTFRFTNTNIIHKAPEWTLIAVVLLHLLSEVSSVVKQSLKMPASVDYLNTLMDELGLQEQDLLNLVRLFKTPTY